MLIATETALKKIDRFPRLIITKRNRSMLISVMCHFGFEKLGRNLVSNNAATGIKLIQLFSA